MFTNEINIHKRTPDNKHYDHYTDRKIDINTFPMFVVPHRDTDSMM